jgi:hypothetical protein
MANSLVTPQTLQSASATATNAKTTFTDTANAVLLLTAGANGAVVYGITAVARGTIAASKLSVYRSKDAGATITPIRHRLMSSHTMANDTAQTEVDFGWTETAPLRLAAGDRLYVAAAVVPGAAAGVTFDAQYEEL